MFLYLKSLFASKNLFIFESILFFLESILFFIKRFFFSWKTYFHIKTSNFSQANRFIHKVLVCTSTPDSIFSSKNRYFRSFFNCFSHKTCVNQSHILRMFIVTVYEVSEEKNSHLKYFIWLLGNCSEHYKWARCQLETLFMDACKVFLTYFFFSCFLSRKHQHSLRTKQLLLNT